MTHTRYEYHTMPQRNTLKDHLGHLNELGQGGWQVCTVSPNSLAPGLPEDIAEQFTGSVYILMREIPRTNVF